MSNAKRKPQSIASSWKDGLPQDSLEEAQIESVLVQSDLTSQYAALVRLHDGDVSAALEEQERIALEAAENAARAAAGGVRLEEKKGEEPERSESSKRVMARARQERGQNDSQAGRDPRKGPKLGG